MSWASHTHTIEPRSLSKIGIDTVVHARARAQCCSADRAGDVMHDRERHEFDLNRWAARAHTHTPHRLTPTQPAHFRSLDSAPRPPNPPPPTHTHTHTHPWPAPWASPMGSDPTRGRRRGCTGSTGRPGQHGNTPPPAATNTPTVASCRPPVLLRSFVWCFACVLPPLPPLCVPCVGPRVWVRTSPHTRTARCPLFQRPGPRCWCSCISQNTFLVCHAYPKQYRLIHPVSSPHMLRIHRASHGR